ncbi:MAG TPA: GldG family protein, partial [Cyclobacteriaceae bacterium]|nr:GldG family protein [Cyclobacteriaceae bacterium]
MKTSLLTTALLTIGIIVAVNLLGSEYHFRLDLTKDKQYTLSRATKDILKDIDDPVTIKAYFSKNLPANVAKTREDFQDMLIEYANLADGKVLYEFVDPNAEESLEQEATQKGIRPVLINVREKDQVKQQKAYLGATVQLGDQSEVIPFVQPGAAMEYALSTAIKKIAIKNKPVIGFVQGHREPMLSEMVQANEQLQVLYDTREITLTDSTGIPDNINTLALIRPQDSIPANHLKYLDDFMARGGRLLVAVNTVQIDMRSMYGTPLNTGLEAWLRSKGVNVAEN